MLAYVFDNDGTLRIKEMPKPISAKDSVVIKVNACSICGTDFRTYIHGSKKITAPRIIGHEVCGTIVEAGSEVKGFAVGDRVAVAPAIGCGQCYSCTTNHPNMCDTLETIGYQYNGGFAEYMEIPAKAFRGGNVNKVNEKVKDEEAVLAEPVACVLNAHSFLNVKKGDYVAVFGSGFIGCMHAEIALANGAEKVIMIEPVKSRADIAKQLVERIETINPSAVDTYEEVKRITGGRGVDVAIIACSVGKAQEDAVKIAAKRARISLFGGLPGESKGFIDSNEIHYKELSVFGVHASTPDQNRMAMDMIVTGKLKVGKYITKIYPLSNIVDAFEAIKNENIMKAVIKP